MPDQIDLLLVEAGTQHIGQLDDVGCILVDGQVCFGIDGRVRLAAAALFPNSYDEVFFQFCIEPNNACGFTPPGPPERKSKTGLSTS